MKRKSSRRDFLRGRAAGDLVADVLVEGVASDDATKKVPAKTPEGGFTITVSREAMACEFEVRLHVKDSNEGTELALAALDVVDELEDQMSFFRDTSELTEINRTAAEETVDVEPRLFDLLELAQKLFCETDGAFDITSTPLWQVWGFARRRGAVPEPAALEAAKQIVGGQYVELDCQQHTVRFLRPGVQLNLGSIGKGYALDRCAELLVEGKLENLLIHGGGSSVLARGHQFIAGDGTVYGPTGWEVGIVHPVRPDRRLAKIQLCDRGLSTSGGWYQSFVHQGKRYSHILDPRTGWPAEGVLSVTVLAPTAAEADALSTAFYVMGRDASLAFCQSHPEISAVLVLPGKRPGEIEIETVGLDDDTLQIVHGS